MASTYSSNLKIELMSTGENSGTWGNVTNTNLGTALEQAVVGYGNPDYLSDANLTITITNTNAAQAARALVLNVTSSFGSLSTTRELVVPTIQKQYIVQNNTTGGQSITVKTSAGTGITVPNGRKAHLYVDGTNVIQMFDFVDINGGTIDGTAIGGAAAAAAAFTTLTASGATTLNGAVALGDAAADLVTVPGTINSALLFTDNSFDIGATGANRPRNLFLAGAATIGGNLSVGGTLTLTGGVNLNGNVTVGDTSADTLTINATITSNLLFTDNTYDIGASGATRPRNLFLAGNATIGGAQTLTGALTVDSTTDSSSATTGSIQTDGGVGIAKALFVGTTVTVNAGTANGVAYLNGSKVLTTGSALTFDGTNLGLGNSPTAYKFEVTTSGNNGLKLNAGTASADQLYFGNTAGVPAIGTLSNSAFTFIHNGSEAMRLTSTGLGIGTSSPFGKLDVQNGTVFVGQSAGTSQQNNLLAGYGQVFGGSTYGNVSIRSTYEGSNNSASLDFFTAPSGTTSTERMRLDSSGNLGLGGPPSAWASGRPTLEFGGSVQPAIAFNGTSSNGGAIWTNAYFDGASRYKITGAASRFDTAGGQFAFFTAPSGTAGDVISFTQALTLTADGNLVAGATTAAARIVSVGSNATVFKALILRNSNGSDGSSATIDFETSAGTQGDEASMAGRIAGLRTGSGTSGALTFSTTNLGVLGERARITTGGALLVGTTSAGTMSGGSVIGVGARGGIITNSAGAVANGGTLDIAINTGGGGYQGFLAVANTAEGGAASRTQTTFSVFGRGTDSSIQQIATDNGTTGAATFTVTTPSDGVIRVTNTSGNTTTIAIQFFGGTSF